MFHIIARFLLINTFCLLLILIPVGFAHSQTLEFFQIDFDLDGFFTPDSDWGMVKLHHAGHDSVLYFNLSINGTWQIQDYPVITSADVGTAQANNYCFSLNVPSGMDVMDVDYGWTLTLAPTDTQPPGGMMAPVHPDLFAVGNGGVNFEFPEIPFPAEPLIGGFDGSKDEEVHVHRNFPNQQCDNDECIPAAVSNCLKFLNREHNMGLPEAVTSIDSMKAATGWGSRTVASAPGPGVERVLSPYPPGAPDPYTKNGSWEKSDPNAVDGQKKAWWEKKRDYMRKKGIPVTTRKFTAAQMNKLGAEIDDKQAIEMTVAGHTTSVVGIMKTNRGCWVVEVAHDKDQNDYWAGTELDTGIWDPVNKKWSGRIAAFAKNSEPYFIVQCPRNRGVGGTFTAPADPDTVRPPYGAWTPTSGHGTEFPETVGETIFLGKNNLADPVLSKTWTITLKGDEASKYDIKSLMGYTKGAETTESLLAERKTVTDFPGSPPKRVITAKIVPQPDWEKVEIERIAPKGGDEKATIEVHTTTHCQMITHAGGLVWMEGYPGVLDEPMFITEVQIFPESGPVHIGGPLEFTGPEGTNPWIWEEVWMTPNGESTFHGGIRWFSLAGGIRAEQDYSWMMELAGEAGGYLHVYMFNIETDQWHYYLMEMDALSSVLPPVMEIPVSAVPNPFNAQTEFAFELSESGHLLLQIFTIRGELVTTLADEPRQAGPGRISWDGLNSAGQAVSSGVYLYKMSSGLKRSEGKVALVK